MEYLHINLLENHVDRCHACKPLHSDCMPSRCRRGLLIEILVLRDLRVGRDGHIYSVHKELGYHVRIEIAGHNWAVFALLRQVDGDHLRTPY
jgi:hypothetical protein